MIDKLKLIEDRFKELSELLIQPDIISDQKKYIQISKEYKDTKKIIDMFGSLFFMVPMSVILWMYSWFFMWRHLITPKVSASDKIELLIRKSKILKWNVETIGFSPNGFSAYFLFKILIIALVALIFIQAISFFWRSFLEWKEGENSENKYLELEKFDEFSNVSEK